MKHISQDRVSHHRPLYFLDYISTKTINSKVTEIVDGIIKGCEIAEMDLIGGETAEHYRATEYDMAGFCTGIVEKTDIVDGSNIKSGDVVIGIESSGLHSNGYTLINDMIFKHKIFYKDMPELLTPTTIYSPLVQLLLDEFPILGMSHITGGGLPENLPRCLPEGLTVDVEYDAWERPELFNKIQEAGEIDEEEMRNVFNLGIGFCLVVPIEVATYIQEYIKEYGMKSWIIGEVK